MDFKEYRIFFNEKVSENLQFFCFVNILEYVFISNKFPMEKNEYLKIVKSKIHNKNSKKLLINQINNFYDVAENYKKRKHKYNV